TILFDMELPNDCLITNRVYHAHRDIHAALNNFIKISTNDMLFDDELMLCYLKELIIKTLQYDFLSSSPIASTPMQQRFENELLNEVLLYISETIYEQLTIEEICMKFSISRSSLQTLFKNNLSVAPKQYISDLKLRKSKLLIKESIYTISEISSMLGFTSIHYFSRKFKQQFGITPTDYAKTIYN
ncbi:MAG: AraC family transcriptional regulator, partial [Longicatena sp.]